MTLCRSTGIDTDDCAHCPVPTATLPEPAVRRAPTGSRPEPAHKALSERLRSRLLGRGRGEWFGTVGRWTRCALCHRRIAEGEPVRFRYGRTAKDMATQGWCCEALDTETVKALLRRGGFGGNEAAAAPDGDALKARGGLFG